MSKNDKTGYILFHLWGQYSLMGQEPMGEDVSRLGFEPRTLGLKVRCSAELSYRPKLGLTEGGKPSCTSML